ncbi:MAG: aspartate aminotransferase family protein [Gemmatales bacterium]|nr:aspartate aminotransferase family protein [Gemmatales bacterium]MDW8386697.1 aspartate aminotransferase family protein [Gemmatales bacterium]
MNVPILHPEEPQGNRLRDNLGRLEPKTQRTYTPSLAVLARSSGVFHWTPDGRRLYDFTSGVLVANLGHNPTTWFKRFQDYLGWSGAALQDQGPFFEAVPLTSYNAATPIEIEASRRLIECLQNRPGGKRLEQVLWAASGSEAVQKALWAALARDRSRDIILATRYGFHGKKGLAGATTGCETDPERDPRVRFISFPREECCDVSRRQEPFNPLPYRLELEALREQLGRRLNVLITEPYLGGGGSYHPHPAYLQMLQDFCREHDIVFVLDEVQSNFGRTGRMFAFESYGIEPDVVLLGKGLANGVPGAAAIGPARLFDSLDFGEGSDTYSGNALVCAAVLATLDCFEDGSVLENCRRVSPLIEAGLIELKRFPFVKYVRGEPGGMVWGVEFGDFRDRTASQWANDFVLACYRGNGSTGVHLLGPLAKKVVRIAPPLVITVEQANQALRIMSRAAESLMQR